MNKNKCLKSKHEEVDMNSIQYLTAAQIVASDCYPFTMGQIRQFLLMRHKNGLQSAVRKIGKRLYLRRDLFEEWIEEQVSKRGAV